MSNLHKKQLKNRKNKVGLPPGTLPESSQNADVRVNIIQYNTNTYSEEDLNLNNPLNAPVDGVTWINLDGVTDTNLLKWLGKEFKIHNLVLEDIASPDQRPKIDEYNDLIFSTWRMIYFNQVDGSLDSEQISFVLGKNYLITFQEKEGDIFNSNRERLRSGRGRLRSSGPDYLFYTLIDTIVDHYFAILENLGEKIDTLEVQLIENPKEEHLKLLYKYKNETMYLKKWAWPTREILNKLLRDENQLISPETEMYFKDVYDHCQRVMDTIESYRDLLASMMDLYLNSVSNRLNQVMKVLTVISTIFIPLTFLTGIYGMNFQYMPELAYAYSYPILIATMFLVIGIQFYFFKKRGWL